MRRCGVAGAGVRRGLLTLAHGQHDTGRAGWAAGHTAALYARRSCGVPPACKYGSGDRLRTYA
eukprot:350561-Chlamydomonas_euryale.AAC.19